MSNENKLKCTYTLTNGERNPDCPYILYNMFQLKSNSTSASIIFLAVLHDIQTTKEKWVCLKMFYNFEEVGIKTIKGLREYKTLQSYQISEKGVFKTKQKLVSLISDKCDVKYAFNESYRLLYEREVYKYITEKIVNQNQSRNFVQFISDIDMNRSHFAEFYSKNSKKAVNFKNINEQYCINIENKSLFLSGSITEMILYEDTPLSLYNWLNNDKYKDDVQRAYKDVWFQILYTLSVLSHNKICHNDLHHHNILMKKLPNVKKLFFTIKYGEIEQVYMLETDIIPYFYDWDFSYCEEVGPNPNLYEEDIYIVSGTKNVFNPYTDFHTVYSHWDMTDIELKRSITINQFDNDGNNMYTINNAIRGYLEPIKLFKNNSIEEQLKNISDNFQLITIEEILKIYGVDNVYNEYKEKYECLKQAFGEEKSIVESEIVQLGRTVLQLLELRLVYGIFACRVNNILGIHGKYYELELSIATLGGSILTSLSEKIMSPLYILTHTYDEYTGNSPVGEDNCILNINEKEYTYINNSIEDNEKINLVECKKLLN
jgi:hypothetical protein